MSLPNAQIILSTYNGERYLAEQLRSLQSQEESNWICFVRDDGSSDRSAQIVSDFCSKDSRFIQMPLGDLPMGPQQSFSVLLSKCSASRPIFFCDQDDVWSPFKLSTMLRYFKEFPNEKLLIASDLSLVDKNRSLVAHSMMKQMGYDANHCDWPSLLGQNIFPGCAMGFSGNLLPDIYPIPKNVCMHDWWSALVALMRGRIVFHNQPLVLYRQHDQQASGGVSAASPFKKFKSLFLNSPGSLRSLMQMRFKLWFNLRQRLQDLGVSQNLFIQFYDELNPNRRGQMLLQVLKFKIRTQGVFRSMVFIIGISLYGHDLEEIRLNQNRI